MSISLTVPCRCVCKHHVHLQKDARLPVSTKKEKMFVQFYDNSEMLTLSLTSKDSLLFPDENIT